MASESEPVIAGGSEFGPIPDTDDNTQGLGKASKLPVGILVEVEGDVTAASTDGKDGPLLLDEADALKHLTENMRDQSDLERDITNQANLVLIDQEDERDQKRIDKVKANIDKLEGQKRLQRRRLDTLTNNPLMQARCLEELKRIADEIKVLHKDIIDIQGRIDERHQYDGAEKDDETQGASNKRMPNETQREFLIRTGKITPFSRMPDLGEPPNTNNAGLSGVLADAEEEAAAEPIADEGEPKSHQNLRLPGFAEASSSSVGTPESEFSLRPRKRRRLDNDPGESTSRYRGNSASEDAFSPAESDANLNEVDSDNDDDDGDDDGDDVDLTNNKTTKRKAGSKAKVEEKDDLAGIDDGNEQMYQSRLRRWIEARNAARIRKIQHGDATEEDIKANNDENEEWLKPCPDAPDHLFDNDIRLPGDIYPALFDYQKTGVQWLGELYSQQVGGIVGDEMGLGKTIQVISFLAGLHYSQKLTKPVIVVAPATVLRQWVNEFHRWWPPLRVSILHSSGSGMLNMGREGMMEEAEEMYRHQAQRRPSRSSGPARKIVDRVVKHGHVLVTTYAGLQTYADALIPIDWGYAVLDEGHKIRNPNTTITIYCKELRTPNRIILSGTPMQNNLIELWSLFDFVFPMRLGTLVNFRQSFEVPIKLGGYANATNLQVLTATKCAETLKETISPYLLQRLKVDVASDLPKKTEQVLFCKLTKPQREAYEIFLSSDDMSSILNRTRQSLYGIDILRKICNHPDLLDPSLKKKPGYKWGNPNRSGKMQVVRALLEMWKRVGHKTLLFSQGVQMLNIIEDFIKTLDGFNYLRMDGGTSIKDRQSLVDRFNNDPGLHVFLLTTKVGGLGVNLTGANRVIIFDPDWNPSTDVQARERAWRLGQKKEVAIYRLMTAGTIEEKIYHRQIFKQFLTNKILKDPKQRQTFQMKDLYDLFTLGGTEDGTTETGEMFKGTEIHFDHPPDPVAGKDVTALSKSQSALAVQNVIAPQGAIGQASITSSSNDTDAPAAVLSLTGVSSLETFQDGDPSNTSAAASSSINAPDSEARIMSTLFSRSGIHSALSHDQIINGKKKLAADRGMLEREARKVASEAAAELRRAGELARSVTPGTVTWTGEFGSAGRPQNIRRGAASGSLASAGILASLAARQGLGQARGTASGSTSRSGTPGREESGNTPRGKDFMRLIRDFIRRQGGSVASQALVNHFDRVCRTQRQTEEFKHMLGEIAILERAAGGRMRGKWVLKEEFR